MEDLETLTRGNGTEVKVVLASIALALGVYAMREERLERSR